MNARKRQFGNNETERRLKKSLPPSSSQSLRWVDEEINSSDSDGDDEGAATSNEIGSDNDEETTEQKRIRLAKEYLQSIQHGAETSSTMPIEGHEDIVSSVLRKDRLEAQGKYFRAIADTFSGSRGESGDRVEAGLAVCTFSGHKQSVTCVALSSDDSIIYSGSKDNSLMSWDLEAGKRKQCISPSWRRETHGTKQAWEGELLSVAVTSDGRYLVSGGRDRIIRIYDSRCKHSEVKKFEGHRDAVTCLAFRRDSYSLFSGSLDRCLKHWDLGEMGYLETMFGHQDGVNSLDCWTQERPVSASSDRTLRVWRVSDESHLVLRGHKSSIDSVRMITEDSYITGGQDGAVSLWKDTQKKPIAVAASAHGDESAGVPRWIVSTAAVRVSDFALSGSFDGFVRLWKVNPSDSHNRMLRNVSSIPAKGFVNGLAVSQSSRIIIAGLGQEHRLGRWWHRSGNLNKVIVWRRNEEDCASDDL